MWMSILPVDDISKIVKKKKKAMHIHSKGHYDVHRDYTESLFINVLQCGKNYFYLPLSWCKVHPSFKDSQYKYPMLEAFILF